MSSDFGEQFCHIGDQSSRTQDQFFHIRDQVVIIKGKFCLFGDKMLALKLLLLGFIGKCNSHNWLILFPCLRNIFFDAIIPFKILSLFETPSSGYFIIAPPS